MEISGQYVPLLLAVAAALVGWGVLKTQVNTTSRNVKELWEKKGSAEDLRRVETKAESTDKWTREHEDKSNEVRRQFGERFAQLETSIKLGMNSHQEVVRVITKLEVLVEKMESKFEDRLKKLEEAVDRRNNK